MSNKGGRPRQQKRRPSIATADLDSKPKLEWLQLQLRETRKATKAAWEDRSWVAVQQLKRQEREIYDAIALAKAAKEVRDPDEGLTEDQALHQIILPAIRSFGRPLVEEVYRVCLEALGMHDQDGEGETAN
jgi:hypothetical protein